MVKWHLRPNRKPTGGFLNSYRKKARADRGSEFLETSIGENKAKIKRGRGGNKKIRLVSSNSVNASDSKGHVRKAKIITVVENPANPNYVRRNIITKGCVVKTEAGLVKITSRPSQGGILNGVLIEEKK